MAKGKTALITGASSGIGKELAIIHASRGGNLILVARREAELKALKTELESNHKIKVDYFVKDLSIVGSAKELFEEIKSANLDVDYLINNAGFGQLGKFHEIPWERELQMINLNMIALTELTYLFIPELIKRDGKILNTSSTASLVPGPLQAVYFATKAYVTSLSNALSNELSETKVTVTNLMPGATESEFEKTAGLDDTPLFAKPASTVSVALDGYNAMMRGCIDVISGVPFAGRVMITLGKFAPKKMVLKQLRAMQEAK